ncbi:MAG: universal stress protein [Leptolyngbya sp. SIO1E4]|nr:universal stress protein [Leptolyngbya sp. SIO1E4]
MFTKILVPLDRSQQADDVFAKAVKTALDNHSQLMMFTALDWDFHLGLGSFDAIEMETDLSGAFANFQQSQMNEKLNEIRHWLKGYVDKAAEQDIPIQSRCAIGHPGPLIRDLAQEWGADLIIMGRRGLGGLPEMLLGSVSHYVLHHVACSVLVVQGNA